MTKPQDHRARAQAIDTRQSILLQAPAGSGKTELLSQRILALLSQVSVPEEVLALTFTNKAANEMRHRVLSHLQRATQPQAQNLSAHERTSYQLATQVLAQDKAQGWGLLEQPHRLAIQTIDAFNLNLVRRMPLLSQTGGLHTTEEDAEPLYIEAVQATLGSLETSSPYVEPLFDLLAHVENNQYLAQNLLVQMLQKRDQWLRLGIVQSQPEDLAQLQKQLTDAWQTLVDTQLSHCYQHIPQALQHSLHAFANYQRQHLDSPVPPDTQLHTLKQWADLLFTQKGTLRKTVTKREGFPVDNNEQKAQKKAFLDFLTHCGEEQADALALIHATARLPVPEYQAEQWAVLRALLQVLHLCVANLQLVFQAQGKVDFTEINLRAHQALGSLDAPSHVAQYLDSQISHILVDEFQDTNHLQFHLLEKLMAHWSVDEGRTFFAVGDPMQSIYRFREADVGLFLQAKQHGIAGIHLTPLTLAVNFRSQPEIVQWCNQHFPTIFPAQSDALNGAVRYHSAIAHKAANTGTVQMHGILSENTDAETAEVVRIVQEAQKTEQSIHILVRKKADLLDIAAQLKHHNIAFHATEMVPLGGLQLVEDIRNISRAIIHLGDRAAWLALLRAPWCGLTLADLQTLVDTKPDALLWHAIIYAQEHALLSADGHARLTQFHTTMALAFALRTQLPLPQLLHRLWVTLYGKNMLQHDYEHKAAEMAFQCLENCMEPWGLDIQQFDQKLNQLFAPGDSGAQVECMTIHKAKGLEADVVIVPRLNSRQRPPEAPILRWCETRDHALLLAPIKATRASDSDLYGYLQYLEKQRSQYETMRLLYVACTRAVKQLHLFATVAPKEGAPSPHAGSLLSYLWPQVQEDFSIQNVHAEQTTTTTNLTRLPLQALQAPALENAILPTPIPIQLAGNQEASAIGTVFHRCCELLSRQQLSTLPSGINTFIQHSLAQLGFTKKEAGDTVYTLLETMLADDTGRWILACQGQQEWPLSYSKSGVIRHAVIDRCFVDKDIFWIVDYKTSAPEPDETIEDFSERMRTTHAAQLHQYQSLAQPLTHFPVRVLLYCPAVPVAVQL